ncbi:hypothetical protein Tco_1198982 [Tanacetum coccineum]
MLDLGLEVEEESTVALHLVRFIKEQLNEEHQELTSPETNGFWLSIHLVVYNKELAIPEQKATGKGISNPLMADSEFNIKVLLWYSLLFFLALLIRFRIINNVPSVFQYCCFKIIKRSKPFASRRFRSIQLIDPTEVVDFLKGTSLRYALTHNPTIYDSLVKQFWQTVTVRTLANGTQQLVASIDSKEYIIIEASVRSKL